MLICMDVLAWTTDKSEDHSVVFKLFLETQAACLFLTALHVISIRMIIAEISLFLSGKCLYSPLLTYLLTYLLTKETENDYIKL